MASEVDEESGGHESPDPFTGPPSHHAHGQQCFDDPTQWRVDQPLSTGLERQHQITRGSRMCSRASDPTRKQSNVENLFPQWSRYQCFDVQPYCKSGLLASEPQAHIGFEFSGSTSRAIGQSLGLRRPASRLLGRLLECWNVDLPGSTV